MAVLCIRKCSDYVGNKTWVQILALPITSCVCSIFLTLPLSFGIFIGNKGIMVLCLFKKKKNHCKGNLVDCQSPFKIIKEYFIATIIKKSPKWNDTSTDQDCPDICYQCVLSRFSCVQLFVTLRTVAPHAPLSTGFSRQEYWSELPCPPPVHLPNPASLYVSCTSRRVFTTSAT